VATKKKEFVLVTTSSRGVFAGYLVAYDPKAGTVTMRNVRNCLYWGTEVRGFLGLAVVGPIGKSRVGALATELQLTGVTSVTACTPTARKQWEAAPW
jgi:hypothetical protein